jgi:hypothetical protein
MTSNRSEAYGRVVRALDDLSASKFHADEQAILREAADTMFFCERIESDDAALDAMAAVYELADWLIAADRVTAETAARLIADIEACGPDTVAV